jgi:XapX domain-containing protein
MKPYLIALSVGVLVGIIYGALNMRSPAPPIIALVGLFGILLGEQIVPVAKRLLDGHGLSLVLIRQQCGEHVFGSLPTRSAPIDAAPPTEKATDTS